MTPDTFRFALALLLGAWSMTAAVGCSQRFAWTEASYWGGAYAGECEQCDCEQCECEECDGDSCTVAGDPDARRYSDEWWAYQATLPVGARQKCKKGKQWPPYPRPTGKQQPLVHRYHHAHYWPHPYDCQDRAYVRQVFDQQTANGWKEVTTLYDYHFDADTGTLTQPGQLQLRWILDNAPPRYRVVYLQSAVAQEINQQRLASVREESLAYAGDSDVPPVMLRRTTPYGRPASEIDAIRRAELATMPEPRISAETLSGDAQ